MKMVYVLRISWTDAVFDTTIQGIEVFGELKDARSRQDFIDSSGKYTDSIGRKCNLISTWIDIQIVR